MKLLTHLIATIALALAAPMAGAYEAQFELLPAGTQASAVPPQIENPRVDTDRVKSTKRLFFQGTGGVPTR